MDSILKGKCILVTAGPTREPIDPVRYITNHSSGKMGYAIAQEALRRGIYVVLITGPVALEAPKGAEVVNVVTTQQMYDEAVRIYPAVSAAIMAAAPADFRPAAVAEQKIKKAHDGSELVLRLVENPDIAAALGRIKEPHQRLVVFAAETQNLLDNARGKLMKKNADFAVANDVSEPGSGFNVDTDRVTFLDASGVEPLPLLPKEAVAARILDKLESLFQKE